MISKIVISLIIGAVVYLVCVLVGGLLATTAIPFIVTVGTFLKDFAGLLGLLAALWNYFSGGFSFPTRSA